MSLVLEHEDVIFGLTVNFDADLDGAGVDLFRFVEIVELAVLLELLCCKCSNVHEAYGLLGDPVAVNVFTNCKIIVICIPDLLGQLIIAVELNICKLGKERCVAAVVGPVCIENPDLGNCRLSSLLLEEILNELDILEAHCKTHGSSEVCERLIVHCIESFNHGNRCRNIVFVHESVRLICRSFTCLYGIDEESFDLSLILFSHITIEGDDPGALDEGAFLLGKELNALSSRVSSLVELAGKRFDNEDIRSIAEIHCLIRHGIYRRFAENDVLCLLIFLVGYARDIIAVDNAYLSNA